MKNPIIILLILLISFQFTNAQEVTTHQYRRVESQNLEEYLKRETTYWSKLAESEMSKGNLTYWAILVKVGGENILNSPNILIINSFKNMDASASIWSGVEELFPNVKMEDIETNSLSTTTDFIYLRDINRVEAKNLNPENDFKYMHLIYHNIKNVGKHFKFENDTWAPLTKKAMDQGITTMKVWGNAIIVSPESRDFPYSSASYDIYPSMHEALSETFSDSMEFPEGFFNDLTDNYAGPRNSHLYRIVKVVSKSTKDEGE